MKLKKINAVLSLLSIAALLLHVGYTVFSYLTFYYNPTLKLLMSVPLIVLVCLHAVCGMASVFLQADGTRLNLYPRQNVETVIQRLSAALIFPMLILHINTYGLLSSLAEGRKWFLFALLLLSQPIFYGTILTHIAVSLSRAMITLGWLTSMDIKKKIDRIVYAICAVIFLVSVCSIIKGQLVMFIH